MSPIPHPSPLSSTTVGMTARLRRRRAAGAAAVVATLALAGCGGSDDSASSAASEDLAERLAEAGAGADADVDIDSESGEVDVSTDDGDLSIGSDELPEDFPSDVPLPADYELTSSLRTGDPDAGVAFNITGTLPGGAGSAFDDIAAQFTDDGWEETYSNTGEFDGGSSSSAMFDKDGTQVVVAVQSGPDEEATFSYTVSQAAG